MSGAESRRNVAVLLAGGVGTRVGLDVPKQLIKIAGHPIMEHTLSVLDRHPDVDEIVVMMAPGHLDSVHAMVKSGGYSKVSSILEGADTRNGTTLRALDALGEADCKVLFHDAVRPLLSPRIVTECFQALDTYDAVDVAIPSADTIIEVGEDNTIKEIPPRARLRRGQTPQAFTASVIRAAYAKAGEDPNFEATDDCTVVLRYLPDVPDLGRPGRRAQHEGHRADRHLPGRQALPAHAQRPAGEPQRRGLPRRPRGPHGSGLRWLLRHRRRRRAPGRGLRRERRHVQPVHHRHQRRPPRGHRRRGPDRGREARLGRLRGQHRRGAPPRPPRRCHRRDRSGERPRSTTSPPC